MEFFVLANSNAAPFFSDTSTAYVEGETPERAVMAYIGEYNHPAGLFAAELYESADAYHKGEQPIYRWYSERAIQQRAGR